MALESDFAFLIDLLIAQRALRFLLKLEANFYGGHWITVPMSFCSMEEVAAPGPTRPVRRF